MSTAGTSRQASAPVDVSSEAVNSLLEAVRWMPTGLLLMDRDFRIIFANEAARKISRLRSEDLNGPTHWELYPETVGTEVEEKYRRVLREGVEEEFEVFYAPFSAWIKVRAFRAGDGVALDYSDITELKQATLSRDLLAERMRSVLEATTDAVFVIDREWTIRYLNRAAREYVAAAGDVLDTNFFEAFPGVVYEGSPYLKHYYAAMERGIEASFEATYGEPLNVEVLLHVLPSDEGLIIFARDVTKERRDERAIRASEEKYRVLTELGPQAVWTGSADGRITYANRRFQEYLGEWEVVSGEEWLQAFYWKDQDRVRDAWADAIRTGEPYEVHARIIRARDGVPRWWSLQAVPVRDESGAITMWLGIANDVHDSRVAQEQLEAEKAETERQRRELQAVYDTAPVGLALFEPKEFRYLQVNARQAEIIGLPRNQILGRRFQEVATTEFVPALFARVAKGESFRDQMFTTEFYSRPGEARSFNVNYSPVFAEDGSVRAISAAVLEITKLRRAEAALVQSEKLAAVGRLAASISHEINNPLEAVTNLLYLASMEDGLSEQVHSYLQTAQDELSRVSQIATQTLRFHRQANAPTPVTAAQLVDPVLSLYGGRLVNSGIRVEVAYSTDRTVSCFENDIRQVLNNLIANAIDAMRTGGRLRIRAHNASDPRKEVSGIRIAVSDTGHGMSPATMSRIFEPFYTTKGLNGNGLGLWISQEIVERHHGHLRVRSSQDRWLHGTIFTLFLPRAA